ncbi:acyltransferase family protein [Candidatus Latescibacterota bacterium]
MSSSADNIGKDRILSIDALRGFDMFLIIGGGTFIQRILNLIDTPVTRAITHQMHHPQWHGFTSWDLIFPLFLFLVGTSIPLSLDKRLARGTSQRDIISHVLKRSLILYFFGMVMEAGRIDALGGLRYTGVLHRIAFCYCCTSFIVMKTTIRGQVIWIVSLLTGYWLVMRYVPVPGHGAGVFTPEGNVASYLDRLMQPGALRTELFDNEGFLSTFPAIATTLMGSVSGWWLNSSRDGTAKTAVLAATGTGLIVSGLMWGLIFPINKLLWTSSFALLTGGMCMCLLALFYWVIDIKRYRRWAFPLVVIGMNALTIYIAGALFDFGRIVNVFTYEFIGQLGPYKPVVFSGCVLAVKWIFLYVLYRKRIFLKA